MKVLIHGTGVMSSILKEVIEKEGELEISGFADDFTNEKGDIIIDFSHFSRLPAMIDYSLKNNIPMVICTTGYDETMLAKIVEASTHVPIVLSSNTCIGINLMNEVVAKIAPQLRNFDIEIIETHHNRKVDSPSGTAKSLFNIINDALDNEMFLVSGRNGLHVRDKKEIGMHSIRGGSVVGEHSVIFYGDDEIIEIKHSSTSRRIFANGAIKAAKFLIGKKPGLYRMKEVLQ
ncbi:dihydrodipicolinate reductase [Brachyspira intermedia PWS/A]|uniref:4-hydroxy-tetrahydrodipicolinate reductase n=1 Tax=Brachyspira intermedia (strain ATCC 51140 / PWS/A) TaxID=1045858 RepID=G0EJ20_BRAIP|nr:4-hydroxy-tetrahydrodipicolinate reductase [Brachyspira intermedia]AEM21097.1 dihydrodipicolinate reductase [Brachyspira intermedia PWS/A]